MYGMLLRIGVVSAALASSMIVPVAHSDVPGSADHPLVPRYKDSTIVRFDTEAFTDFRLFVAPATASGGLQKNLAATTRIEGRLTRLTYRGPADRSTLEVFRNYEKALADAGFTPIFTCAAAECGGRAFNHAAAPQTYYMGFGEFHAEQRYLAARLRRSEGDVYLSLYIVMNKAGGGPDRDRPMIQLDIVELGAMEDRMVVVEADTMRREIAAEGRVAVYGILFDFDSDRIRPDSREQLDQIAHLLKETPSLSVFVVGHTDNKGGHDHNLDLSQRRARSVVEALVRDHGIDRGRMTPVGVAMVAPVASNRTEQGRARNRRVELVER